MKEVINWMDIATIIFSFITMIGVFINYFKNKKQLEKINIVFILPNEKEVLIDDNLTRKDCQRNEIQGILRTKLIKGRSYYEIDYLKDKNYFENIYQIQISKEDKLKIYLNNDELEQFGIVL